MRSIRRKSDPRTRDRKGTATVEFAVIAPVFLTLALGTWEMGTAVKASNNLAAAVREGGRLASLDFAGKLEPNQTPNQKVTQDIQGFLSASGVPGSETTVAIVHADGAGEGATFDIADEDNYMRMFRITVTVPYSAISMFPINFMNSQTLKAELVCRRGRSTIQE